MASEGKEESTTTDSEDYRSILPEYGWRVHLSNTYSHTPQACFLPRWTQIPKLVGLGLRLVWKYFSLKFTQRSLGKQAEIISVVKSLF